jgi:hypothetical protein
LRVEVTHFPIQLLVEQCDEARPERGHGARTADDLLLAIDQNLIAGFGRGIAGDVGNPAAAGQVGNGKTVLTPPPVAPPPDA